tara:strand:+ start:634 stop:840 length:207 start_codon:yes stop_codon:yes gene_type:complete
MKPPSILVGGFSFFKNYLMNHGDNMQEQRIEVLEQQVQDLLEQQKNLLGYIKELAITITETRMDKSDK